MIINNENLYYLPMVAAYVREIDILHQKIQFPVPASLGQPPLDDLTAEQYNELFVMGKAVSMGGDSDTIACITGAMAEAFYRHIPQDVQDFMRSKLPPSFLSILTEFEQKYVSR